MSTSVGVPPSKQKTKAKQRYLKKKKEKRKHKTHASRAIDLTDNHIEIITGTNQLDEELANSGTPESIKPPKKRLRIQHSPHVEAVEPELKESEEPPAEAEVPPPLRLPFFPLPVLPDAPSMSVLAFQGLDQALVDAEVILPSKVLPIPSGKDDGGTSLSDRTRSRLKDIGITELFAVQTSLLPFLLPPQSSRALYLPYDHLRDVCVSAPTGSGKTLAYVLPIIETVSSRVITRLRALIVLPTRDLVTQVREVFEVLSKGTNLKIGAVTGQHSFLQEQSQIIGEKTKALQGGSSKVDILICTPGRLMDHINGTPNFSLQHLRYLVIDEADRLLAQSFQNWLAQVLAATRLGGNMSTPNPHSPSFKHDDNNLDPKPTFPLNDVMSDGVAPILTTCLPFSVVPVAHMEHKMTSCQKLLFSATLTRDPSKIAALDLRDPKYFIVQGSDQGGSETQIMDVAMEKFSMPSTLIERMIISTSLQKPLIFFHLVHSHQVNNALVFTKSAESTTRLVRLFKMFESARAGNLGVNPLVVRAYSSDLSANERKIILEQFKNQKVHVLVCSDLISRGIDISHVSHVISYDVPIDMRKYVHRVGRTARAGKTGEAWTLVEEQEARYFKQMLKEAGRLEKVKRLRISDEDLAPLTPNYEVALNNLKEFYTRQQTKS